MVVDGFVHFKFFEIEHMTDKQVGETFETYVYSPSEMDYKTFPLTVAGLATKEQLSEIFVRSAFGAQQKMILCSVSGICKNFLRQLYYAFL